MCVSIHTNSHLCTTKSIKICSVVVLHCFCPYSKCTSIFIKKTKAMVRYGMVWRVVSITNKITHTVYTRFTHTHARTHTHTLTHSHTCILLCAHTSTSIYLLQARTMACSWSSSPVLPGLPWWWVSVWCSPRVETRPPQPLPTCRWAYQQKK